jgi:hypothetical protein
MFLGNDNLCGNQKRKNLVKYEKTIQQLANRTVGVVVESNQLSLGVWLGDFAGNGLYTHQHIMFRRYT